MNISCSGISHIAHGKRPVAIGSSIAGIERNTANLCICINVTKSDKKIRV